MDCVYVGLKVEDMPASLSVIDLKRVPIVLYKQIDGNCLLLILILFFLFLYHISSTIVKQLSNFFVT